MSPARTTPYAAAIEALGAAAAAFRRAKDKGLVFLDEDSGRLFAIEADEPNASDNPAQLRFDDAA